MSAFWEAQRIAADDHASPTKRFQDKIRLQLLISPGDRIWIDRQVGCQLPHAGDHLTADQHTVGHCELHLVHDLFVDRYAARRIN